MRTTTRYAVNDGTLLVTEKELLSILSCGRQSARKIAADAGAIVKIGRRTMFHLPAVREYLENARTAK